jgi:hypothetical protein
MRSPCGNSRQPAGCHRAPRAPFRGDPSRRARRGSGGAGRAQLARLRQGAARTRSTTALEAISSASSWRAWRPPARIASSDHPAVRRTRRGRRADTLIQLGEFSIREMVGCEGQRVPGLRTAARCGALRVPRSSSPICYVNRPLRATAAAKYQQMMNYPG